MHSWAEVLPDAEKVPLTHALQLALPRWDQKPAPHSEQTPAPYAAAPPALHCVLVALPLHSCPPGHAEQARSSRDVGARVSTWEDKHVATALHASALLRDEKVDPATHARHVRSWVAVPSVAIPEPTGHVRHTVHDSAPVPE